MQKTLLIELFIHKVLAILDTIFDLTPDMIPKYKYNTDHSGYVVSKNTAKELLKCYHALYKVKCFIFRLPNLYFWSKHDTFYADGKLKQLRGDLLLNRKKKEMILRFRDIITV